MSTRLSCCLVSKSIPYTHTASSFWSECEMVMELPPFWTLQDSRISDEHTGYTDIKRKKNPRKRVFRCCCKTIVTLFLWIGLFLVKCKVEFFAGLCGVWVRGWFPETMNYDFQALCCLNNWCLKTLEPWKRRRAGWWVPRVPSHPLWLVDDFMAADGDPRCLVKISSK